MNIGIIGGGSIGLLVSSYLEEHHQVTLYVRREGQKRQINSQQINRVNKGESFNTSHVVAKLIDDISSDIDLCIICVKQMHLDNVLKKINRMSLRIPLLFLQNGMGHIEALQAISNPIYVGVVNHGAHKTADNHVDHLGNGSIDIASLSGSETQMQTLIEELHEGDFPMINKSSWEYILKEKLIVNAVINPLTALFDVPNGKIIANSYLNNIAKKLCEETALVLQLPIEASWEKVKAIAEQTQENISSMRADIQGGRETEVDAITGYIVKTSKVAIPYTLFIYDAILALQQERTL